MSEEILDKNKKKFYKALKELGKELGILVLSVFVVTLCWNVIAKYFGFKCISYIVGLCIYILFKVLFKRGNVTK